MRIVLTAAAAAFLLGLAPVAASAQMAREVQIGSITHEVQPEREVINLRRGEGLFRGIRIEVRQSDVEIRDLRITFDDGATDVIRVNQLIRAGSSSRVIELDSRRREVRSVAVSYLPQGTARILLFGVGGGGGQPAPEPGSNEWSRLGCKDVKFLADRDTLKVNREGRFRALRLSARKSAVEMFNLRVTYLSGVKQEVPVRQVIPPGGVSRPIELLGRERGIERIEMIYRSIPTNLGTAEVCIDGFER